ncbi:MAG: SDR family oxidoreductase, partial [Terriglobales bacterium]
VNFSGGGATSPSPYMSAYGASKAAIVRLTETLAVELSDFKVQVNAIAPGFFLTDQNRFLLTDEKTGELTERGKSIIAHTPMARFGNPGDLLGAALWLLSPAASFVTGAVIPVDGGFNAYSGV